MRRDIQPSKPHFDVLAVDLNTNEFSPAGDGYGTGSKATGKRVLCGDDRYVACIFLGVFNCVNEKDEDNITNGEY